MTSADTLTEKASTEIAIWAEHHDQGASVQPARMYRRAFHSSGRTVDFILDPDGYWTRDHAGLLAARLNLRNAMRRLSRKDGDRLAAEVRQRAQGRQRTLLHHDFRLDREETTRLAALSKLGGPSASPTSAEVAELAWYTARLLHVATLLREELDRERAYQPEIAAAVGVHLTDECEWEDIAAWCGGALSSESLPSGEFTSDITIPDVGVAHNDDWIVLDVDGTFRIVSELKSPTPGMTLWDQTRQGWLSSNSPRTNPAEITEPTVRVLAEHQKYLDEMMATDSGNPDSDWASASYHLYATTDAAGIDPTTFTKRPDGWQDDEAGYQRVEAF